MKRFKLFPILLAVLFVVTALPVSADTFGKINTDSSIGSQDYGSRYSTDPDDWFADGEIVEKSSDEYILPDLYNTGYVSDYEDLVDFGEKYPEVACYTSPTKGYTNYTITNETAAKYNYVFEGFKIEHGSISFYNSNSESDPMTHEVVVRDFYINSQDDVGTSIGVRRITTQARLIILDGEIEGSTSSQITGFNVTMKRCYLHKAYADQVKGFYGQYFESNYICDGGYNGGNPHPDCVQFTSDNGHGQGVATEHVYYYGNRMDAMLSKVNCTNSCIILQSEFGGGVKDVHINHNWFNGGGVAIQIGTKGNQAYHEDVEFVDNYFGYGERWVSNYKYTSSSDLINNNTTIADTKAATFVDIGSIVYYADGERTFSADAMKSAIEKSVLVSVSNYTLKEQTIVVQVVVVDPDSNVIKTVSKEFTIKGYIPWETYTQSEDGTDYETFRYEDQPYDVECVLDLSSVWSIPEGSTIYTNVWKVEKNGAEVVRKDHITYNSTASANEYKLVAPDNYLIIDNDPESKSYQFVQKVNSCATSHGADLRQNILDAMDLYTSANDNIYGVTDAKDALATYVEKYNSEMNSLIELQNVGLEAASKQNKLPRFIVTITAYLKDLLGQLRML